MPALFSWHWQKLHRHLTHPGALLLVHPECRMEVLEDADYIGSTSGIIEYASESDAEEFIIGTEPGVMYELERSACTIFMALAEVTQTSECFLSSPVELI